MRRKSVIRSIAGLNLGLAVVLLVLLSTASIPISMGQTNENTYVVFSAASSNDPVNADDPGYDKDVACTEVSIASPGMLTVTVTNAYPGYNPELSYTITNVGTVSAEVTSLNITSPSPIELIYYGMGEGDVLAAGASKSDSLEIRVPQEAEQGVTYKFSVTINFAGAEESRLTPGPGSGWPEEIGEPLVGTTEVAGPVCAFRIIQLTVSPDEVYADEPVTVGVLITNPCEEPQTCEVVLKINGVVEGRKEVEVKPGETKRVTFTISKHVVGTYLIEVNGVDAGTLVVKEMELFPVPLSLMPQGLNWLLIVIIALAAAAIASLITYLVYRKKQAEVLPGD